MKQKNESEVEKKTFSDATAEDYEEISEKKTSKLGYVLLFVMVVFVLVIGQTVFSDLADIPERPSTPSYCISALKDASRLDDMSYMSTCTFSEIDRKFNLDSQYSSISPSLNQIAVLNKKLSKNRDDTYYAEREVSKLSKDYDLSLQEKMAQEKPIINKDGSKADIVTKKSEIDALKQEKISLESQRDGIVSQISPQIGALGKSYDDAYEYYRDTNAHYKFKVFLLMLVFVLPFFIFSIYSYLRLKKKDSPYTIIFTAILTASSLLFLQVVLTFLYDILPKAWLERIFRFFMTVPFLRYVIYYGSVILVIALFGGLVYYIQKKVFSPEKVAIRRLKDNKCPGCSFTLNAEHSFCPKCGYKIKEECFHCNKEKIRYLAHCPYCGNK